MNKTLFIYLTEKRLGKLLIKEKKGKKSPKGSKELSFNYLFRAIIIIKIGTVPLMSFAIPRPGSTAGKGSPADTL